MAVHFGVCFTGSIGGFRWLPVHVAHLARPVKLLKLAVGLLSQMQRGETG